MGVYIKGMEMPKNCGGCKFFVWKRGVGQHCAVDDRITFHATIHATIDGMDVAYERNGNCPLIPVPPHGIIDREQILDSIRLELAQANAVNDMEDYDSWMRVFDYVRKFPTVIPAEEVYGQYTDTAGNFHWYGTHSGEHTIKAEEGER